jgi:hypothetical protein
MHCEYLASVLDPPKVPRHVRTYELYEKVSAELEEQEETVKITDDMVYEKVKELYAHNPSRFEETWGTLQSRETFKHAVRKYRKENDLQKNKRRFPGEFRSAAPLSRLPDVDLRE